jgi:Amt family ammonium transporter
MIPGLGYFYGGITHRKNLLTSLLSTALGLAVVSVLWFIWGYSLSFSQSGSVFIGDLRKFISLFESVILK